MNNGKRASWILALALSAGVVLGSGAQTMDQAAIAQALAAAQASQAAAGVATGGTAPTVASQQPVVSALTAPAAATVAAAGAAAQPSLAQTPSLSSIETMFAGMAAGLGMPAQDLPQFGYSLFDQPTAPSLAAIGDDYVLGPGDSLVLYLWGDPVDIKEISSSYTLTVDRNGFVFLPPAGQIAVWGQSMGTVRGVIKGMLDRRYKKLDMSLTLSTLRQFPVFVSGYASTPGTVLATGADTVLTVLSRAGGVKKTGSLRKVSLVRQGSGGKAEKVEIDFYDTLIKGIPIDLRVREGDSLFVPGIGPTTALAGEVRRPGIYELKGETSIAAALSLAGGALPSARFGGITLLRFSGQGKSLATGDINDASFSSKQATDGDFIFLGKVSDLLVGQTEISGPIKYPGRYEVASFGTLGALLSKAQALPETNLFYGRVYRMDPSGRDKSFAFSPRDVIKGSDIPLAEFDKVVLYRYDDTAVTPDYDRFADTLVVSGPVKYPGFYLYKKDATLAGLLADNALTLDANSQYGEIVRKTASGREEYLTFSPDEILAGKKDVALARLDQVRFVKRGADVAAHDFDKYPGAVALTGQVAKPDIYALGGGLKLSGLLTKDQILLDTNLNYAELTRLKADGKNEYVTFRPAEVLDGSWDVELGERDVVKLLKVGYNPDTLDFDRFSAAVQVQGPVQFAGLYAWKEGMKLSALLALAKPALETNQVYAEVVRPLGGTKSEYVTFAPREVAAGVSDLILKSRDVVRLYTTTPTALVKQGAETAAPTGAVPAQATPMAPTAIPAAQNPSSPATLFSPVTPVGSSLESADLSRFLEVVTISGSVRYAGPYARTPTLKLSSVVTPDQMLEETNLDYAELTRLGADGTYQYQTFAPRDVLAGTYDLDLKARDSIRLVKKTSFGGTLAAVNLQKFSDAILLTGHVARPEVYAFTAGMKLSSVLTKDQVLLDSNLNYAEILRSKADGKNEYITFRPAELLAGIWDFDLGPRDTINLVKIGYSPDKPDFDHFQDSVVVTGPLNFAGLYAWRPGMKLSWLQASARILLETNQVYADVLKVLPGGKTSIQTFAPREVASGVYDTDLSARDTVRYYSKAQGLSQVKATELKADEGTTAVGASTTGAALAVTPGPGIAAAGSVAGQVSGGAVPAAAGAVGAAAPGITTDTGFYLEVVATKGQVRYVGPYARTPSLMLSSVVTSDQILQDTDLDYAELTRRNADGTLQYTTFSPRDVLSGAFDMPLRAQDSINYVKIGYLPDKPDFDHFGEAYAVTGRAQFAGLYSMATTRRLSEIVTAAQLLSDTDIYYGEIERWVSGGRTEYLTFSPLAVLLGRSDMTIYPRDIVRFVQAGDKGENHDFARYPDTVIVKGFVRYPGRYAWYKGMKLGDILTAEDLLIDTDTTYAEVRKQSAEAQTLVSFSPSDVVRGEKDFDLSSRDVVIFYPKYFNKPVTISGEVVEPKVIPYYDGMELSAALRSVGLNGDFASYKAVVTKAKGGSVDVYLKDYFQKQASQKTVLDPGDSVSIRKLLPDEHLPVVTVRGSVKQPQAIEFKDGMRLADALNAAGGYESRAYPNGLVLIRKSAAEMQQRQVDRLIAQLDAASAAGGALPSSTDSNLSSSAAIVANLQIDLAMQRSKLGSLKQMYKEGFGRISLDIPDTIEALVASPSNVVLERDDTIFVPSTPTYVIVSGEVADQNVVAFRDGLTVRQAIKESGWLSDNADLQTTYILRASGKLDSTEGKGFLFFRPSILNFELHPGDTVVVNSKSVKLSIGWSVFKDVIDSIYKIMYSVATTVSLLGL